MRTTKAQTYLIERQRELEGEVRRLAGEVERVQAQLSLVKELRAKLAEAPKRPKGKGRVAATLPDSQPAPTTTAAA